MHRFVVNQIMGLRTAPTVLTLGFGMWFGRFGKTTLSFRPFLVPLRPLKLDRSIDRSILSIISAARSNPSPGTAYFCSITQSKARDCSVGQSEYKNSTASRNLGAPGIYLPPAGLLEAFALIHHWSITMKYGYGRSPSECTGG